MMNITHSLTRIKQTLTHSNVNKRKRNINGNVIFHTKLRRIHHHLLLLYSCNNTSIGVSGYGQLTVNFIQSNHL